MSPFRVPVRVVETIKRTFGLKTWQVESAFVFCCLAAVAAGRILLTGHGWVEWIGVLAVFGTFSHASVANRLEEREERRARETGTVEVECYRKLAWYFLMKEIAWFAYFLLVGAYSALVGVIIFLLYGRWRKAWRKDHPVA